MNRLTAILFLELPSPIERIGHGDGIREFLGDIIELK
jgi:hypothetical protein